MRSKRRSVTTRQKAAKRDNPDKRAIDRDSVVDFSTGEVARRLHISSRSACRLCSTGELASHRTPGGHIRVRLKDLEEYEQQRAGGDVSVSSQRAEISRLSGERDQLQVLKLQLEERRVRRDLARIDQEDAKIQQEHAEASAADLARSRAALEQARREHAEREQQQKEKWERQAEFERRQRWADSWVEYGLRSLDPNLPREFVLQIQPAIEEALRTVGPTTPRMIVEQLVLAAIQRVIVPWQRQHEIEKAIKQATQELPFQLRTLSDFVPPTEWETRAMAAAREAVSHIGNVSLVEVHAAAVAAGRQVASEYSAEQARVQEEQQRKRSASSKAFLVSLGVAEVGSHLRALHSRDAIFDEDLARQAEIETIVRTTLQQRLTGGESFLDAQRIARKLVEEEVV